MKMQTAVNLRLYPAMKMLVRVNEDKTLTATGEGIATITVSGSGASATFDVTVKTVPVTSVSINNMPDKIADGYYGCSDSWGITG